MIGKYLKALCLAPLLVGLCQCDQLKPKAPPSPYAATVTLKFTAKAEAAMTASGDDLVLLAYYYGEPAPGAEGKTDKVGRVMLGLSRLGWSGNTRRVHLDGRIDTARLPLVRGDPQLLVSIYSITPEKAPDDLIHCKTWMGSVKQARAQPPVIGCELENGDTGELENSADN